MIVTNTQEQGGPYLHKAASEGWCGEGMTSVVVSRNSAVL